MNLSDYLFYQDDWATIYCGDCLEVMPLMGEKIDMILCDLPYGTTACKWDTVIPFEPLWKQYNRLIKDNGAILLFGSEPFSSYLRMSNIGWFKYDWIWHKNKPTGFLMAGKLPMKCHEIISVFYKYLPIFNPILELRDATEATKNRQRYKAYGHGGSDIYSHKIQRIAGKRYNPDMRNPTTVRYFKCVKQNEIVHPTQKPVLLFEYFIRTYTKVGDTVLDNCVGSGTTLVASKNLKRKSICIEIEPKYCEIAVKRLRQEVFDFGVK